MFLAVCEMKIALWVVNVGLHDLFMCGALNGTEQCSLGTMCAQGSASGF